MLINGSALNQTAINGGLLPSEPPEEENGEEQGTGADGKSAYEIWLELGNTGSKQDFIDSLQGQPGPQGQDGQNGQDGANGKSAYDLWLQQGNVGSESDFIAAIQGEPGEPGSPGIPGDPGKSAYQIWLDEGHTGTESDFLQWLREPPQGKKTTQLNPADTLAGTEKIMLAQNNVSRVLTLDELKAFLNS